MSDKSAKIGTQILTRGVEEFFEDLVYNAAYSEVMKKMNSALDEKDSYINQAFKSAGSVIISGALMYYLQKQEQVIHSIIYKVEGIVAFLLFSLGSKLKNRVQGVKGRKLKNFLGFFFNGYTTNQKTAEIVVGVGNMIHTGQMASNTANQKLQSYNEQKNQLIAIQNQRLNYVRSKISTINETLLFKLFTAKFTEKDKELIRKITGNPDINIDDLNKVSEFMFVKDSNGNIIGLAEQFMMLINALGYFQNKGI